MCCTGMRCTIPLKEHLTKDSELRYFFFLTMTTFTHTHTHTRNQVIMGDEVKAGNVRRWWHEPRWPGYCRFCLRSETRQSDRADASLHHCITAMFCCQHCNNSASVVAITCTHALPPVEGWIDTWSESQHEYLCLRCFLHFLATKCECECSHCWHCIFEGVRFRQKPHDHQLVSCLSP